MGVKRNRQQEKIQRHESEAHQALKLAVAALESHDYTRAHTHTKAAMDAIALAMAPPKRPNRGMNSSPRPKSRYQEKQSR
jgi:hypothetical protein